jgi:Ulp1 family protease
VRVCSMWKVKGPLLKLPLQRYGYDCGVFVCHYVDQLQRGGTMEFTSADTQIKRSVIRQNLIKGIIEIIV